MNINRVVDAIIESQLNLIIECAQNYLKNKFLVSYTFTERNNLAYSWFTKWFFENYDQNKLNHKTVTGFIADSDNDGMNAPSNRPMGHFKKSYIKEKFILPEGKFFITIKGIPCMIDSILSEKGWNSNHSIKITSLITYKKELASLISEMNETYYINNETIKLIVPDFSRDEQNLYWECLDQIKARKPSSLFYADNIFENTSQEIKAFTSSAEWYTNMGIPWRRGLLLYGPPGNGKSSLVLALAGHLCLNIYSISLGNELLTDSGLQILMMKAESESIILIEDIDSFFGKEDDSRENKIKSSKLTFSGLLNAIDGVVSKTGIILVMTTNKFDKLDDALIRAGRIDKRILIDNANHQQIISMFKKFFPNEDYFGLTEVINKLPERQISMATLQEYLIQRKDCYSKALADVALLIQSCSSAAKE